MQMHRALTSGQRLPIGGLVSPYVRGKSLQRGVTKMNRWELTLTHLFNKLSQNVVRLLCWKEAADIRLPSGGLSVQWKRSGQGHVL